MQKITKIMYQVRSPRGITIEWGNTPENAIHNAIRIADVGLLASCKFCEVIIEETYHDNELIQRLEFVKKVYPIHIEHIPDNRIENCYRIEI